MGFYSASDREREDRIASVMEQFLGVTTVRRPGKYNPVDFDLISKDAWVGVLEITSRRASLSYYKGEVGFKAKTWDQMVHLGAMPMCEESKWLGSLLAWEFPEGIYLVRVNETIPVSRRTLRDWRQRNINDTEPGVFVPLSYFGLVEPAGRKESNCA